MTKNTTKKPTKKQKVEAEGIDTGNEPEKKNTKLSQDEKNIKRLITKGKKRGYLTQSEVLEFFPNAEDDIDVLDFLYGKLLEANIDVYDVESEKEAQELSAERLDVTKIKTERATSIDPVRMYLKEIGKSDLLKADEEVELAKRVEVLRYNRAYPLLKKQLGRKPRINELAQELNVDTETAKEIRDNTKNYTTAQCEQAEKTLTQSNLRLVVSIAKRYMGRGLSFLDLIQEGNIGLMKAVEKFDWRRGFKFSTYATWWIRQAITRAIADQARTIRIPVHMIETINKYKKVAREIEQRLERPPKPHEVAKEMDIDIERAKEIVKIMQDTTSLEKTVGREEDSTLKEFIKDTSVASPFDSASHELLKGHIGDVLATLNPREQKVLELRFGLKDGRTRTLEEVGREFGVTRERIRQIEAKALRKLRHPSRSKRLRDYLD